jgi:hypothetical protein
MASLSESDGTVEVCGEQIQRLHIRDYLPWLEELKRERKAASTKLVPAGMPQIERFKILRNIELEDVSPDDLQMLMYTGAGQIRVIETAITKAKSKEAADKIIDGLTAAQAKRIAFELSGLFTAEQLAEIFVPEPRKQQTAAEAAQPTFGGASPLPQPAASPASG